MQTLVLMLISFLSRVSFSNFPSAQILFPQVLILNDYPDYLKAQFYVAGCMQRLQDKILVSGRLHFFNSLSNVKFFP